MSALDEKKFIAIGRTWTARFGFNAMCAVEVETGEGFLGLVVPMLARLDAAKATDQATQVAALAGIRMTTVGVLLRHALAKAHPDIDDETIEAIFADIGLDGALDVVAWAVAQAMGIDSDDDENDREAGRDAAPRPSKPGRKRARATG